MHTNFSKLTPLYRFTPKVVLLYSYGFILIAMGQAVLAESTNEYTARRDTSLLNSIGVNSSIDNRGETLAETVKCIKYLGMRWIRSGIEGNVPISELISLHNQTGVKFSWSPGSGGSDLTKLLSTAKELAAAGALLSFEGPNEPNNWALTYKGVKGGGSSSWMAVAEFQRDLYKAVKSDPILKRYPVWSISEEGAETDNVGLQFLTIPKGAHTLMPAGTIYGDDANVHNYIYHPNSPGLNDNKTWNAADPTSVCKVDGLYGEYGRTWAKHYKGYSQAQLLTVPRVTTETGCLIEGQVTQKIQALNLLSMYLDQFTRGWNHTAVYLLRDRVDEAGNQKFGFYKPDYTPRLSAIYLHNLTTILADSGKLTKPGKLYYSLVEEPATVHHLLVEKSDGEFDLIVWDERLSGEDNITVNFGNSHSIVKLFDPTVGTQQLKNFEKCKSIQLVLSDHPIVISIPPANSPHVIVR